MSKRKGYVKKFLIVVCLILLTFFVYIFGIQQPTNKRDWEVGLERLPKVEIKNNMVTIQGIRDDHFEPKKIVSKGYIDRSVNISTLEKVWFIVEPFSGNDAVAHTYFVFDFKNQDPLAVTVEARREKGEKYEAFLGLFNQYELMYIWGTESDITIRRVLIEGNKLHMYPLNLSRESAKGLFLQLAEQTHSLETRPRFYNTLTNNCTNELAKSANGVKANAIPWSLAYILPGYADDELYKLGYLPQTMPLEQLTKRYYISDFVKEHYKDADFSKKLRIFLSRDSV